MDPIRVAHVVNNIGFCGVRTVVYHLLRDLSQRDYELHVYCVIPQPDEFPEIQRDHIQAFEGLGVTVHLADPAKKTIYVMEDICRSLAEQRIDIVHTHSHKPNVFGRMAAVLCGDIKLIAHYHSEYKDKWRQGTSLLLDERLSKRTDRLIAVSKSVQRAVYKKVGIPRARIEVIPNGVDFDRYAAPHDAADARRSLGIPEGHRALGVVGRIVPHKGQADLLAAGPAILEAFPQTCFLIIGQADEPKQMARLEALSRDLGIEAQVHFTGFRSDMPRVLSALDLLVMPSHWEGHPTALLEGMASGAPVIASDIAAIAEVATDGETALIVPRKAPEAIASAAISLLGDANRARALGEAGRARAREFSWTNASGRIHAIYQDLMAEEQESSHVGGTLFLVRHGHTEWTGERHIGWSDVPLSAKGRAQANAVTAALCAEPIDAIYASPLVRAEETIRGLSDALGLPVHRSDNLKEFHVGQLEGKRRDEHPMPSRSDYFYAPLPGGESLYQLHTRAQAFLRELTQDLARGCTLVVVAHYRILERLYEALQGRTAEQSAGKTGFRPDVGSIYRVRYAVMPGEIRIEDGGPVGLPQE